MADSKKDDGKTVCVTGAGGFIASHIVAQLLQKGYKVRGTVRDSANAAKTKHLRDLPGAAERLTLLSADMTQEGSFDEAVQGCYGVFHTTTPVMFNSSDGEKEIFTPAIKGLQNILTSVKKAKDSLQVFALTSSMAAVSPSPAPPVKSEKDWSDAEKQKKDKNWYGATKTTQEQMAQKFFEEEMKGCRFVAICPTMVVGPMLQPGVNETMKRLKSICQGSMKQAPNDSMSYVDVRDVAAIHIAAFEKPEAKGRYMCLIESLHWNEIVKILKKIYPKMPDVAPCDGTPVEPTKFDRSKQDSLGVAVRDIPTTLNDAIDSLIERGEL